MPSDPRIREAADLVQETALHIVGYIPGGGAPISVNAT